tara:strand:- start:5573 stop:5767 length:195 start_codon:yes stop_codon:yes gene_type:complete
MKTNRPTLIKIGIVAAVLVAVVLYLRQQKESETEGFRMKKMSKRMSKRARKAGRRASKSMKKWR